MSPPAPAAPPRRPSTLAVLLGPLVALVCLLGVTAICIPLFAAAVVFLKLSNWSLRAAHWLRDALETLGNKTEEAAK